MTLPLEGALVADFSRVLAGPLTTQALADLGARVVKVERPGSGDDTRAWGPPWTGNTSAYFECCNRNKESVTLDLGTIPDRQLAVELARRADVVVENFRTGTLERYGLGYEQIRAVNPRVVYCSITGFGSGGGADLPGYDFLVQAVGGLMSVTGAPAEAGGDPMKVGVALVDVLTSKDALAGILAALLARSTSGVGQRLEVNLLSSLLGSLANQAASYAATGTPPERLGNEHPSIAPYELLQASDAPFAVACGNDRQFQRLAEEAGVAALAADPRFATNAGRVQHRRVLVRSLNSALASASAEVWVDRLTRAGVPAGRVGTLADGFALADALGLEPLVPVGADVPAQVRHPVRYGATPVTRYDAPPRLGEHSDDIRQWLTKEPTT